MTSAPLSTRYEHDVTIPAQRVRSKSETPKSQREAYLPEKVILPSATDYFQTAAYIDQQTGNLAFAGSPAGTPGIVHYLWRHTVRSLKGVGPEERIGYVLTGKANRPKIATENNCSVKHVGRVLDWLEANGWIKKQLGKGNDLSIAMLMNQGLTDPTLGTDRPDPRDCESLPLGTESPDNTRIFTGIPTGTTTRDDDDSPSGETPSGEEIDLVSLANLLGVDSPRANIVSLANSLAAEYGAAVVFSVAEKCRADARTNPAGLFFSSAKDMCAQHIEAKAKAEARASETTWYDEHRAKEAEKKASFDAKIAEAKAKPRRPRSSNPEEWAAWNAYHAQSVN